MPFSSVTWIDPPCPSIASATCCIGLHTAVFCFQCIRTIQQELLVKTAYCFPFSGADYIVRPSQHITFSSCFSDVSTEFLPSGQLVLTSKIPGQLGFPIQAPHVISMTHSMKSMACVKHSLNSQPTTGRLRCQEELCFGVSHFWSSSNPFISCQNLFFSRSVAGLGSPAPEPQGSSSDIPGYLLPDTPGKTILPSCGVELFTSYAVVTGPRATAWAIFCFICSKAQCCSGPHLKSFFFQVTW